MSNNNNTIIIIIIIGALEDIAWIQMVLHFLE